MLGGVKMSDLALQDENRLADVVMAELRDIMGITAQPDFVKVYTHKQGIPQYPLGHQQRLATIDKMTSNFKRLYITGNAYRGIGVNDCIENSYTLAERIVQEI